MSQFRRCIRCHKKKKSHWKLLDVCCSEPPTYHAKQLRVTMFILSALHPSVLALNHISFVNSGGIAPVFCHYAATSALMF